jgi:uncharacterized protein
MPITINDRLYGPHTFTSPVLIELINSPQIQRMKGISQLGPPDKWCWKKGYQRFEHSLGVAILLSKLGAPLETQVAGLLHDIGHTAFSHVSDFLFGDPEKEDLNDKLYFSTISSGEISTILRKYKILPTSIKDIEDFPLLKRKVPNLCADTVDYCLREMCVDGDYENAQILLKGVTNFDGKLAFTSQEIAEKYANQFLKMNHEGWRSWRAVSVYVLMKRMLLIAMDNNIITREDFSGTDQPIIDKLHNSKLPEIANIIYQLENQTYEKIDHPKKTRFTDPDFLQDGKLIRLSSVDPEFAKKIKEITRSWK